MAYLTQEFLTFLKELAANNDRDWFNQHKKRYEEHVKKPFENFVGALIAEMQKLDPNVLITPKDAIFRIHRDTRFSKDKSPYKTHVSAIVSRVGRKDRSSPGMYVQISAEDVSVYSGAYEPDKNELQNIREAIASNPGEFEKLINDKNFKAKFGEIRGEKNKRLPKELEAAAAKQPLIANKQFYYFAKFDPEIALKPDLPKILMDCYKAGQPLGDFLWRAAKGVG